MSGGTFPTSVPTYTVTVGAESANTAGSVGLSPLLNYYITDVTALATKVGTGSATPANNQLLVGNGSGSSTWKALTSAELASIVSDETGSGLLVFGTSPTIVTPTIVNLRGNDGWQDPNETWTYASSSTFTIAGVDVTSKYPPGTKLKFTQSTVKYGVVYNSTFSTDTTVTIIVNTDYVLVNAAISSNFYSYASRPQGYPCWFNYSISLTGYSGSPTGTARFAVEDRVIYLEVDAFNGNTSNSTSTGFSSPCATLSGGIVYDTPVRIKDNAVVSATPGMVEYDSTATPVSVYKDMSGTGWTNSGAKGFRVNFYYKL